MWCSMRSSQRGVAESRTGEWKSGCCICLKVGIGPYHAGLSTFPHHKHAGSETHVIPATPPDLPTVLQEIEAIHPLTS